MNRPETFEECLRDEEHGIGFGEKGGWIPVSEKLPEDLDEVIVTKESEEE